MRQNRKWMPGQKKSFVIFICPFDLFGKGRHIYTFGNICKQDKEIFLGDDTAKIFLNAESTMEDISGELKAFLDYVAGEKPEILRLYKNGYMAEQIADLMGKETQKIEMVIKKKGMNI